ncbi:MAG TPA: trypsin-like peptidase domain-containing protein [Longimicrobiales bacterium]|nr:trypsin-like peptidase domain-containing protein [Longimicrobiales bacterium]
MLMRVAAGAAIVAGGAVAAVGLDTVRGAQALQQVPATPVVNRGSTAAPDALSQAFRHAAGRALPGVVHVQVEGRSRSGQDPFGRRVTPQPVRGAGSGFVIRPDGHILTNNHVVEGATRVTVVTQAREEYEARVVGRDPNTDLAVLRIDARGLPVVALGDSDAAGVGDWVVALGYPLQLGVTATAGIVSAKGRAINIIDRSEEAPAPLEYFIQTDAAINPGNSGGPLVDLEGRVVGVNSAIKSQTGFYNGYGFAIPVNLARRVADDLIAYGHVRRPRLGLQLAEVDPVDVEIYSLPRAAGAEVVFVEDGAPAARAGVRLGDVIIAVNGDALDSSADLTERIALLDPGSRVNLEIIRYGKPVRIAVELGEFPAARVENAAPNARADERDARLGFGALNLTPQIARQLRIQAREGVVIRGVARGSAAERAGLGDGLVVESINGTKVNSVQDLERAASGLRPGSPVSLIIVEGDGSRRIVNYRVRA